MRKSTLLLLGLLGLALTTIGASGAYLLHHDRPATIHPVLQEAHTTSPSPSGKVGSNKTNSPGVVPPPSMEVNSNGETYPALPPAAHPEGVEKVNDAD